tara:strand:+ start:429 stop:710 length:282 start_codon:yes stop_codon:yes gene_type:complete
MPKKGVRKTLRVKRRPGLVKKLGKVGNSLKKTLKKTASKGKKMLRLGGMPKSYYGGPVNKTLQSKSNLPKLCKTPQNGFVKQTCLLPNKPSFK